MFSRTLTRILPPKPTLSNISQFSTHPTNTDTLILSRLKHKDWLTPKEATTLLTSLTHPSSTLHFFQLYTSRKDFHPTETLSTTLITKLAQSNHLPPLISLHQTLTAKKHHLFSDTLFYALIKAYAHSFHRLDLALKTLRDMPSFHVTPSHRTFNLVLNALVNSRLYDAARELFLDAPRMGVAPDACSMNILIKGLCSLGDMDGAVRMVEEFPAMGCVANAWTYATVMKGLCEVGRVEEALGLLERMERGGVEVDVAVFNVLIGGLRKEGRVGEGLRVLEGMLRRGVRPNGGSYNEVVCGLVEEGRVEEAKEVVVGMMGREGFVPSFEAYKGLVKGFCEKGMVGEVEWVVRDLVRKGFVPRMGMWRRIVTCVVQREGNSRWVDVVVDGILED